VFSLLLQQSEIEVSHPNESGSTPLHYFCKKFEPEIYNEAEEHLVEQMIKKGSRVDAKNANGETALHNACWSKNLSIARVLLQHGANINAPSDMGETPLHYALRVHEPTDLVTFLIQNGADVSIKGKFGTPLDVAKEIKNKDLENLVSEAQNKRQSSPPPQIIKEPSKEVLPKSKKEVNEYEGFFDDNDADLPPYPKSLGGEESHQKNYKTLTGNLLNSDVPITPSFDLDVPYKDLPNSPNVPLKPDF